MAVDVRIPPLGESVTEAVIVRWLAPDGATVARDQPVLEIETEKAAMEIVAEASGRLEIVAPVGARLPVGAVVARIAAGVEAPAGTAAGAGSGDHGRGRDGRADATQTSGAAKSEPDETARRPPPPPPSRPPLAPAPARGAATPAQPRAPAVAAEAAAPPSGVEEVTWRPPAAQRRDGGADSTAGISPTPSQLEMGRATPPAPAVSPAPSAEGDVERVPMTELRRAIARRLVEAQQTAAILTTFNEIDCGALLELRTRHREAFKVRHGVDLGLMSLFSRASVLALREVPVVNARIEGGDIVYLRRVHLGIAVSTRRGLVVPVVRNADAMSLAALERAIGELATRARDGTLAPDDLGGGTFTITNGGVFGSLLSTPLLNPPQSGILGMHKIEPRPIARDGQVVIRPMMYVALSYDHRLVDGEQAVTFLVHVKQYLEDPVRLVLEV